MTIGEPHVKGSALTSRALWLDQTHGDQAYRHLLVKVQPATAEILRGQLLKSSWYPFAAFVDMNLTMDREWGKGDLSLVKTLGRFGAEANLRTIYRLFYTFGSVNWIMDRAAALWTVHYDAGSLRIDHLEDSLADLHVLDFPTPHRALCLSVHGWAERSVELSGGKIIQSMEQSCRAKGDPACTFRLGWR